jgi:formylmethanofuran dehydrogenase subunit E
METLPDDLKRCIEFHGHLCPGLSLGYVAAKEAMKQLKEGFSEDEELVAIVETDACFADAVQVLTGCTFGKGNFLYKDHGKLALTLLSRRQGRGVRLCLKPEAFPADEEHLGLIKKVIEGSASEEERARFQDLHQERSKRVLKRGAEEIFKIEEVNVEIPPKARIERSIQCDRCGEPTMASKLKDIDGKRLCGGCMG